jgi:hypothetical protein
VTKLRRLAPSSLGDRRVGNGRELTLCWSRRAAAPLRWWLRVADAYDGTSTTALVGVGAAEQSRSSRVMDFINLGLLLG